MRTLLGSLALLMAASTIEPAAAQDYPWCAQYGPGHGGLNCGFVSWQQCQATISGNGGWCYVNPSYHAATVYGPARPRKAKRSDRY